MADRTDPIEDIEVPEADRLEQERDVDRPDAPIPPVEGTGAPKSEES